MIQKTFSQYRVFRSAISRFRIFKNAAKNCVFNLCIDNIFYLDLLRGYIFPIKADYFISRDNELAGKDFKLVCFQRVSNRFFTPLTVSGGKTIFL